MRCRMGLVARVVETGVVVEVGGVVVVGSGGGGGASGDGAGVLKVGEELTGGEEVVEELFS